MSRPEPLENILNIVIKPEYKNWQVLRHDQTTTEPFDPLRLLQSFLESGIDLETATKLFDSVVTNIGQIAQVDWITQDRIYDTVVDALTTLPHQGAGVWVANYTSIFGVEHDVVASSPGQVNVRQKGELKKQLLNYLCDVYGVEDEAKIRLLLGDEEFTALTDQLMKIVRYCGFYKVERTFLDSLFKELSERSVKSIIPSKNFDTDGSLRGLHDVGSRLILARDESQSNQVAGLNILTSAVEDLSAILLRRFGIITRRNTLGSLRQLCDLIGSVGSFAAPNGEFSGARAKPFPHLDRIAADLGKALYLHRKPLKQFWETCEELRIAIAQQHVLRGCRIAEDILASAKLIINPDADIAKMLEYKFLEQPENDYTKTLFDVLSAKGLTTQYSESGYIDVECDSSEHPLLDYGRVLRIRPAFSGTTWDIPARWKDQCLNDIKNDEELIPVIITNQKISQELADLLQREFSATGRCMAILEPRSIESALYKPERIRDLVVPALIPSAVRHKAQSRVRNYSQISSTIVVDFEKDFLSAAYQNMEEDKGASACRDCSAFLESALREHVLLLYSLMRFGKGKILIPADLRITAGDWDGRPLLGMNAYLSWLRAATDYTGKNETVAKVLTPFLLDRRLMTDLAELARLRNSYAHKSREVPRAEARMFLDRVTNAVERLTLARRSYARSVVTDVSDTIKIFTFEGSREFAPANKFSALGKLEPGSILYSGDEDNLLPLIPVLGQCDECRHVDTIKTIAKKNRYTCGNIQCRFSNTMENAWDYTLRKSAVLSMLSRKADAARLSPPSVFISYASEDAQIATNLAQQLEHKGIKVWIYEKKIDPGDLLIQKLGDALESAKFGILLISKNFIDKSWTKTELEFLLHKAIENGSVKLIPVCLEISHADIVRRFPLLRTVVSLQFTTEAETLRKIAAVIFSAALTQREPST